MVKRALSAGSGSLNEASLVYKARSRTAKLNRGWEGIGREMENRGSRRTLGRREEVGEEA